MLWKIVLISIFSFCSVFGVQLTEIYVFIKVDNNLNYVLHKCGSVIQVKENQKIEFYFPNHIYFVTCHNPLANMRMNVSTATLAVTRSVTTTVSNTMEGQWRCDIYSTEPNQQFCVKTDCSLTFKIEYTQMVVIVKENQRYVVDKKCCVHLFYYKEQDNLEFSCSLPGIKSAQLKSGSLKWRLCRREDNDYGNATKCNSFDLTTKPMLNFSSEMEYTANKATLECIYTTACGVENIIKLLFELIPLKPPTVNLNGVRYSDNDTYKGRIGELLTVTCVSEEKGWHLKLAANWKGIANDDIKSNSTEKVVYGHNIIASDNGSTLVCTYSESDNPDASVLVNLEVLPEGNTVEGGNDTQMVVIVKENQRYVIDYKCCVHLFHYKEQDNLEFSCSLPGIKSAQLKSGSLKWRLCRREDNDNDTASDCDSFDLTTKPKLNFNSEMEYAANKATLECIYTTAYGVENIIKLLFELKPLKPPTVNLNGVRYLDADTYKGRIGELLTVQCVSEEKGWKLKLAADWEEIANGDLKWKANSSENLDFRHNITASDNGSTLMCTYSKTDDPGASVLVFLEVLPEGDIEEGVNASSNAVLIGGLSGAFILSLAAVAVCCYVKKRNSKEPPTPDERQAVPLPPTEHIYYTIDYNEEYSYVDPDRS